MTRFFQIKLTNSGNPVSGKRSNELSVTTMDTVRYNFTFETWTFGDIGSSTLYDVAIIDENNMQRLGILQ